MSATANVELHERSPRVTARLAGIFYLLNIATIFLAIFFFRGLFVSGDIAATATNLAAHSTLFGLGFASEIISTACSVCVAAFLYELFKPVDGTVSLLAAFFRLLGCAVAAMGYVFQVAPFQIGKHGPGFAALKVDAVQAVSSLVSTLHVHTSNILLLFFGFHFILLGYLILRSPGVPRVLALLVTPVGLGALVFLAPPIGASLFPYVAGLGLMAEWSLTAWLLLGSGRTT
jgi:hypothetical protein